MHLHQLAIRLSGTHGTMRAREITPSGLHGVFYDIVKRLDPDVAAMLHEHSAPKPYTLAPAHYDKKRHEFAGILISTLTDDVTESVTRAFHMAYEQATHLHIGKQECVISDLTFLDSSSFAQLSYSDQHKRFELDFLTPTSWRAGHGDLIVPTPRHIFMRPYFVWQAFAEEAYQLPADWLDWCEENVFIVRHDIRSVQKNINRYKPYTGFVGRVSLAAKTKRDADPQRTRTYLSILTGLARFLTFSGTGKRTTMGMGCVELLQSRA